GRASDMTRMGRSEPHRTGSENQTSNALPYRSTECDRRRAQQTTPTFERVGNPLFALPAPGDGRTPRPPETCRISRTGNTLLGSRATEKLPNQQDGQRVARPARNRLCQGL